MISIFGIISVVVAIISVAVIVLHNRVLNKRAPVDAYFSELEDLLRGRIEALLHAGPPDSELRRLCSHAVDLELSDMIKALPDIDRACLDLHIEDEPENIQTVQDTIIALNQSIEVYNRFIAGSLPVVLMARVLALTIEESVEGIWLY